MAMGTLYGQMAKNTLVNLLRTNAMATENLNGRTAASIMGSGLRGSSTVLECTETPTVKIAAESGKTESGLDGLIEVSLMYEGGFPY